MVWQVSEVAAALGAAFEGDGTLTVARAAEPAAAGPEDLALATSPAWGAALSQGRARAALVWPGADWRSLGLKAAIVAPRGRLAMARLTQLMDPGPGLSPGISPKAEIAADAVIGAGVSIGAFAVIGAGAVIGEGTRIADQVSIAPGARIGARGLILSGVRIGPRVTIGDRVILQPNAVIGGDGFSFVTESAAHVEVARKTLGEGDWTSGDDPTWHRIHSLGGVTLGDDVEVGASATIDSGTIRPTQVGDGTKIDNLCQIGHNAVIGRHCLFAAQSAVAGSTVVGDRVVAGGKAGIADNLRIGDDVVLAGGSIVLSNVPAGRVVMGYPAMPMTAHVESYKALRRLPRILRRLAGDKAVSNTGQTD